MSTEERAAQIRANMHQDMHVNFVSLHQQDVPPEVYVDRLCDDGMFQVEHLLAEIEDLQNQVRYAAR